jgi:hypothetical protein
MLNGPLVAAGNPKLVPTVPAPVPVLLVVEDLKPDPKIPPLTPLPGVGEEDAATLLRPANPDKDDLPPAAVVDADGEDRETPAPSAAKAFDPRPEPPMVVAVGIDGIEEILGVDDEGWGCGGGGGFDDGGAGPPIEAAAGVGDNKDSAAIGGTAFLAFAAAVAPIFRLVAEAVAGTAVPGCVWGCGCSFAPSSTPKSVETGLVTTGFGTTSLSSPIEDEPPTRLRFGAVSSSVSLTSSSACKAWECSDDDD